MDCKGLRAKWREAGQAIRRAELAHTVAEAAKADFNRAYAEALLRGSVPPGFDIDVHGDGKIKPAAECTRATSIAKE